MSEKEKTEALQAVLDSDISYPDTGLDCAGEYMDGLCNIRKALEAEPDVVALLRWAYEQHSWAKVGSPTAYTSGRCHTLWDVIKELEKTVRLTADGWEWVEEKR